MFKIRNLLLCVLFAMVFNISAVKAEAVLFFSPTRVEIEGGKPVQEIRVTNMSDIARSYNLSLQNLVMNEDGVTVPVDTFDFSAKRMLRFVPRQFDIQPGKKQVIRIMARFPEGTEAGEYHAHLEFLENITRRIELNKDASPENQARARAQVAYAAAIPVIIGNGDIKTDVSMDQVKIVPHAQTQKRALSLDLHRSGNGQGNIFLEADYIGPDGQVKKAAVRRSVYVYRELSVRHHTFLLELLDEADVQKGGQIKVKLYNRDVSESDPIDEAILPLS
ncbi:MAG: hypothetical protein ACTHOO_12405 [Alcanivorax sp.]